MNNTKVTIYYLSGEVETVFCYLVNHEDSCIVLEIERGGNDFEYVTIPYNNVRKIVEE